MNKCKFFNRLRSFFTFFISLFFIILLFVDDLQSIKFIDIDEFRFAKEGYTSGLRVCVFDVEAQKFEALTYHSFPGTEDRRPQGNLLENYYDRLTVDYKANVTVRSPLKKVMVRTSGNIVGGQKFQSTRDEQGRNIAFQSLVPLSASELMQTLNTQFGDCDYGGKDFEVTSHKLNSPLWIKGKFGDISEDAQENNHERGLLGELATRLTLFAYGFQEKLPTQNKGNQGTDGIYCQIVGGKIKALFLTESKCENKSLSPKKIMKSQLNEKDLYKNICSLDENVKNRILNFIKSSPGEVFKGAHRTLKSGRMQWLVKKLDYNAFRVEGMGVFSQENEKKAFIKSIATNFHSSEEMLRTMFMYYGLDSDQKKLGVFLGALQILPEQLSTLMESYKQEEELKTPVARRRLSFEQKPSIENKVKYTRENLSLLLNFIKERGKQNHYKTIKEGLEKVGYNDFFDNSTLTKLTKYDTYPDFHKTKNHQTFWDSLVLAFPDDYKQAVAENIFK